MLPVKNCLACGLPFAPARKDQVFDKRSCARRYRRLRRGPLPALERTLGSVSARDLRLFERGLRRAKPPASAIGYKLYCRELELVLPVPGSRRFDGTFPRHDHFTLQPIEIPRVPLATEYQLIWVLPGDESVPTNPPYLIHIAFPSDMRMTDEVGRRLKVWMARRVQEPEKRPAIQENSIAPGSAQTESDNKEGGE